MTREEMLNNDVCLLSPFIPDVINKIYDDFESREKSLNDIIDGQKVLIDSCVESSKEILSRTCENCKYFVELMNHQTKDGYCDNKYLGTYTTDEPEHIAFDVNKDFGCNKWEKKQCH